MKDLTEMLDKPLKRITVYDPGLKNRQNAQDFIRRFLGPRPEEEIVFNHTGTLDFASIHKHSFVMDVSCTASLVHYTLMKANPPALYYLVPPCRGLEKRKGPIQDFVKAIDSGNIKLLHRTADADLYLYFAGAILCRLLKTNLTVDHKEIVSWHTILSWDEQLWKIAHKRFNQRDDKYPHTGLVIQRREGLPQGPSTKPGTRSAMGFPARMVQQPQAYTHTGHPTSIGTGTVPVPPHVLRERRVRAGFSRSSTLRPRRSLTFVPREKTRRSRRLSILSRYPISERLRRLGLGAG